MFGRKSQKDVEEITAGYRKEIARLDGFLKKRINEVTDLQKKLEAFQKVEEMRKQQLESLRLQLEIARRRGPAVDDVAIKTVSLLKPEDILVASNGYEFWEVRRVDNQALPGDVVLVKR